MRRRCFMVFMALVVAAAWSGQVLAASTVQDFDNAGTGYALQAGWAPAQVLGGGPSGNFIRLNYADTYNNSNFIAFDRTQEGAITSVAADFDFRMFAGSRADGLGFALLSTADYGSSGTASWYLGEEPSAVGSLGIGFDIFDNGEYGGNNHLSVHFNNSVLANFPVSGMQLHEAGEIAFNHAFIAVDLLNGTVSVALTPQGGGADIQVINNFVVPGLAPYEARVAFGARTGAAQANHDLDNLNVAFVAATPVPASLLLFGSGLLGLLPLVRRKN